MDWLDSYIAAEKRDQKDRRATTKRAERFAIRKAREAANPTFVRPIDRQRLEKYGVTVEQYREMLDAQGGVCDVCGKPPTTRELCVDHDHQTGKVRALLCSACNLTLGQNRDADWFRKAADYLERHAA